MKNHTPPILSDGTEPSPSKESTLSFGRVLRVRAIPAREPRPATFRRNLTPLPLRGGFLISAIFASHVFNGNPVAKDGSA
jgi:hypothetical protein